MRRTHIIALTGVLLGAGLLTSCGSTNDAAMSTEEYCDLITTYENEGDAFEALFSGEEPDPVATKAAFEQMKSMIDNLAAKAPAEIKADVDTVSKATTLLIDLLAEYDYDIMTLIGDAGAGARLEAAMGSADVEAASTRLDAWGEETCGLTPGS